MLRRLTSLLLALALGGAVSIAGWWTLFLRAEFGQHETALLEKDQRIAELAVDVQEKIEVIEEQDERIRELDLAIRLLKVDHRLAQIDVLGQTEVPGRAGDPPDVVTRLRFTELGPDGKPLGSGRELEIQGRLVYVETLVIKFGDDYVERGDALRGTSVCLFRRLFGENQSPTEGVPLEPAGTQPLTYADDDGPDTFYDELWDRIWDYANDPALARKKGVRASHGEAPFIEARPGKRYRLELRASGGLTIQTQE